MTSISDMEGTGPAYAPNSSSPAPSAPRVSIVIPTLNEAKNLPHVFAQLPADIHQVVLVDGRSTDDTIEVARSLRPDVEIVRQNRRGKGNALACGFAACTGDIIVMLDADGSANPAEIPVFVAALTSGADFAKGTRFARGGGSNDITRFRRMGNRGLNWLVNALYGARFTDLCYGYNAFWRTCVPLFDLEIGEAGDEKRWGDGFEIETLINVRAAHHNLRITEVGSFERPRIHGTSNLNAVSDGLRVLRTIGIEKWALTVRPQFQETSQLRATPQLRETSRFQESSRFRETAPGPAAGREGARRAEVSPPSPRLASISDES